MIVAVKSYLTAKLVAAGIPANRIAQEAKEHRVRPMPYAELATEPELLERDGRPSGREYDGVSKQATTTVRMFRRDLAVLLTLVHRGEAELGALLDTLLASLERGFTDPLPAGGSQFIRVLPDSANWEDDPAILKNRAEVTLRILFRGGLYAQPVGGTIQQVNAPNVNVT